MPTRWGIFEDVLCAGNDTVHTFLSDVFSEVCGLTEPITVMCWRDIDHRRRALDAGHEVVVCPTSHACYFDHKQRDHPDEAGWLGVCTLEDTCAFDPGDQHGVLGSQGNLWSEQLRFGSHVEYMAYPRMAALADTLSRGVPGTDEGPSASAHEQRLARIRTHATVLRSLGVNACDSDGSVAAARR
ncbi:MAG: family 20 glycosylhydrolase [bacterium]